MYPQNQLNDSYGAMQGQKPSEMPAQAGVASRVADLQKSASDLRGLTYQLKSALGIQGPENEAKAPSPPSTLAEVLFDVRRQIDRTAGEIQEAIEHLNS